MQGRTRKVKDKSLEARSTHLDWTIVEASQNSSHFKQLEKLR